MPALPATPSPAAATPYHDIVAVSFDVGGTLLVPHPSVGAIYAEVMGKHGIGLDGDALEAAFRRAWERTVHTPRTGCDAAAERAWWRQLVGAVLHDLDYHGPVDPMFDELWISFSAPHRWRLLDGARATLAALRQRGYRLAVLSNWDERLRPLLTGLELAAEFEYLAISAELGAEKPDPRIFRQVEAQLALPPAHLLHVGDSSYHDVGGAQAAGWACIQVLPAAAAPSPTTIRTLPELLDWLPQRPGA